MKRFIALLVTFTFIFTLIGCTDPKGQKIDFSETQGEKVKLNIWLDDDKGILSAELSKAFTKKYPNIILDIRHAATVDARERLKTYGEAAGDVFQFPHDHMAQAILEDLVYALPDQVLQSLRTRINPVALDIATIAYDPLTKEFGKGEEQLYAVPISIESVALFYNIDLLNQIYGEDNWTVPTTMEVLLEEATQYQPIVISESDGVQIKSSNNYFVTGSHWGDQYFNQFIYSAFNWRPFGPEGDDETSVGFESSNLKSALQWMITSLKPMVTGTGNHDSVKGQNLFEEGKQPYVISGPWAFSTFAKAGVNFGVTTLPSINGVPTRTYAGAQMLAVYKYSKNKEAAIKFVEFMASNEAAEIIYRIEGDLPALNASLFDKIPGLSQDPYLKGIAAQLETSIPMPTIPAVTYFWGPGETMLKNIWNEGKPIEDEQAKAETAYRAAKELAAK